MREPAAFLSQEGADLVPECEASKYRHRQYAHKLNHKSLKIAKLQ